MPGPNGYGPGGKWIHDRAHRIMEEGDTEKKYGPDKGKSIAYAIATQQAHKVGKSPKDFRTSKGVRVAKKKYDAPKMAYQKTAMWNAFFDELENIEKDAGLGKKLIAGLGIAGALAGTPKIISRIAKPAVVQTVAQAPKVVGSMSNAAKEVGNFMP